MDTGENLRNGGTDADAPQAVASMPNWTPGQKDGQAVATRFIIPVAFTVAPAKKQ